MCDIIFYRRLRTGFCDKLRSFWMDAAQSALRVEKDAAGTQGTADYLRGHKFSEHVTKASSDSEASPEGRHATSNFRMADDAGVIALPHESARRCAES